MGIFAAALTAFLQSLSYISSAAFIRRYNSSWSLLICSQMAMGIVSIPVAVIFFPAALFDNPLRAFLYLASWIAITCAGQYFFFATQKEIESSRLSSLLGLKIIILATISALLLQESLSLQKIAAVSLATFGAIGINSGKSTKKFTLKALFLMLLTVVSYSVADLVETSILKLSHSGNIWKDSLGVCAFCYMLLGIFMIPVLNKKNFSLERFKTGAPYGILFFASQITLFVSFGLIGPVFANVVQSSRGIISVALGIVLCKLGFSHLDVKGSRNLWIRRFICAVIMTTAIILYACA